MNDNQKLAKKARSDPKLGFDNCHFAVLKWFDQAQLVPRDTFKKLKDWDSHSLARQALVKKEDAKKVQQGGFDGSKCGRCCRLFRK